MRPTLTRHRKFLRLAEALKSDVVAVGALELLWQHCYESGSPYLGTADDIVRILRHMQTPPAVEIVSVLLSCGAPEGPGFIERAEPGADVYRVHDLYDHAPEYVIKRQVREAARAQRGPTRREIVVAADNGGQRRPVADDGRRAADNGATPAPAPAPAPAPSTSNKPHSEDLVLRSTSLSPALLRAFDDFWRLYPKKSNREAAWSAWQRLGPDGPTLAAIVTALGWQCRSDGWQREGGRFVPTPARYLTERRWTDEPDAAVPDLGPRTSRRLKNHAAFIAGGRR